MSSHSHSKYIPSLSQIESATKKLPNPKNYQNDSFEVVIDKENSKTVSFEKIKFKKPDGKSSQKWTYKGRIIIDSKFLENI